MKYIGRIKEQHDDHVWMMINGAEWAIEEMRRPSPTHTRMRFWRVTEDGIESQWIDLYDVRWDSYVALATTLLREEMRRARRSEARRH